MEKQGILHKSLQGAAMGASFGIALLAVGAAYASWGILTQVGTASTGSPLSSAEWNKMVTNLGAVDSQLTSISSAATTASTNAAEALSKAVPSGAVMAFNLASCPTGWSAADGGNGRPDLRGEFIRGLDAGRGVDAGRSLKSWQDSQNLSHNHVGTTDVGGNHNHRIQGTGWMKYTGGSADVIAWLNPGMGMDNNRWSDASGEHAHSFSTQASGGNESRPRNVALLYCVKN